MIMIYRITIINSCLALLFVFFSYNVYRVWTEARDPQLTAVASRKTKGDETAGAAVGPRFRDGSKPRSRYTNVTGKNLFRSERTEFIPQEEKVEEVVETKTLRIEGRKIELYGVMVIDGEARAMINDPDIKNRQRPTRWITVGDQVGQYRIRSIAKDSVIFSDGSDQFKIELWDEDRKRKRQASQPQDKPTVVHAETKAEKPAKPPSTAAPKPKPAADENTVTIQTPFGTITRKK